MCVCRLQIIRIVGHESFVMSVRIVRDVGTKRLRWQLQAVGDTLYAVAVGVHRLPAPQIITCNVNTMSRDTNEPIRKWHDYKTFNHQRVAPFNCV